MLALAVLSATPASAADADSRRAGPGAEARLAPSAAAQVDGRGGSTTLFRSTMPDGRVVIGDRPEPGARRTEAIGSAPTGDRPGVARAQQEREYWRQRAEAFAQRQRQRDRDLEAERERERRERIAASGPAAQAPTVVIAPPILYRPREQLNYTGQQPATEYATTPGAAGRNLGAPGVGLANDAPGVGLSGTPAGIGFPTGAPGVGATGSGGFGPGAASGASGGFVGSGFGSSTR